MEWFILRGHNTLQQTRHTRDGPPHVFAYVGWCCRHESNVFLPTTRSFYKLQEDWDMYPPSHPSLPHANLTYISLVFELDIFNFNLSMTFFRFI